MSDKPQQFRDGTSQRNRSLRSQSPDHISVDERTLADWIQFAQTFAKELTYFNEQNQPDGNWSNFFPEDAQAIASAIESLESGNPLPSHLPADTLDRLTQPHFALFVTFLKLLQYPQQQFKDLTQRRLDFYYQQVLRLAKKAATPDSVHATFSLAPNQTEYLLEKGTRLNAGTDSQGQDLHYAVDTDLYITQAQVASVRTLSVDKVYIGLEAIHREGNRSTPAFEKMLCSALGTPKQGDSLPSLVAKNGTETPIKIEKLVEWFNNLQTEKQKPANDSLPLLEIAERLSNKKFDQNHILERLCFTSLEEFYTCFDVHNRELVRGQPNSKAVPPTEQEWQQVYGIVEQAYRKRINRDRRDRLRQEHRSKPEGDFLQVWKFALGDPNPGDSLPPFQGQTPVNLTTLITNQNDDARNYIQNQLFLSVNDFQTIMAMADKALNDPKWEEAYRLLERAQARKREFIYPPIGCTEKRAVYARSIAEAKPDQPLTLERFQPFSAKPTVEESAGNSRKAQVLGIAIASPILHLREGERVINLTLGCQAETLPPTLRNLPKKKLNSSEIPLVLQISSTQGWLFISDKQIEIENPASDELRFSITLDPTQPAITALSQDDGIRIQTSHPVIRIILKESNGTADGKPPYQLFQDLCLETINIQVSVTGLKDLQLRNDRASINPKSSFEPFGSQPTTGASFYFVHPEIVSKKLERLSLKLEWIGLPVSFATHYGAYFGSGVLLSEIKDDSFKAQLELFINRSWHTIDEQPLFRVTTTGTGANAKTELPSSQTLQYNIANFAAIRGTTFTWPLDELTKGDLLDQDHYFRLELTHSDFQHNLYPFVLNKVARAGETQKVKDSNTLIRDLTVYPPYNPKVKSIAIDYTASAEISLKSNADNSSTGQIFQLHPFGYAELKPIATAVNQPNPRYFFLPQYDEEGSLYIGLQKLHPPQWLTLLFQLVSGSGNADLTNPKIEWSYLTKNGWQAFQVDQVLSDATNGLLDSGILRFSIPEAATNQNTLMPLGLYWLRASVKENAAAIPDVLDIRAQAVKATFIDQDNDPDHLGQPLAAQSIQSLVERRLEIARVEQPYSSFGGRRQETQPAFYTRVSERLRHKQRAITRWDYERLVLERFPQIYKVKCLTQAEQNLAPGAAQVTLVVIPNLSNTAPFLPLEPKVPQYLLREIEAYLQAHTSPFVKVVVKNPYYERIKYRAEVKFVQGAEQGYYLKKLNEELVRFLSPWAYEEQSDISFGSSIHSSTVIHFLETRPYVDYVANLKLFERVPNSDEDQPKYQEVREGLAQVKQADSILVSEPEHIIGPITTIDYQEEAFEGIDYMIIGVDFVVA